MWNTSANELTTLGSEVKVFNHTVPAGLVPWPCPTIPPSIEMPHRYEDGTTGVNREVILWNIDPCEKHDSWNLNGVNVTERDVVSYMGEGNLRGKRMWLQLKCSCVDKQHLWSFTVYMWQCKTAIRLWIQTTATTGLSYFERKITNKTYLISQLFLIVKNKIAYTELKG